MKPEDAAKDVNLKPPGFFVATTASQRQSEGPKRPTASVQSTGTPPVVIVSYGSSSTPTGTNFHHGHYALAQPEAAAHLQQARPAAQSEQSSIAVSHQNHMIAGHSLVSSTQAVPDVTYTLTVHAWCCTLPKVHAAHTYSGMLNTVKTRCHACNGMS